MFHVLFRKKTSKNTPYFLKNSYFCRVKQTVTIMEKKNPIDEARRYVENAKTILDQHGEYDKTVRCYGDSKYVRMAGNTLWNGILIALEYIFNVSKGKRTRPDISDYKEAVAKRDKKLLTFVNSGYNILHLSMGYDGEKSKSVCDEGFRLANAIIDRCAALS